MALAPRRSGGARLRWQRAIASFAVVLLAAALSVAFDGAPARAAVASDFNAELLIADSLFYDARAMSAAQIQTTLDARIGRCQNGKCLNVAVLPAASRARQVSSSTGNVICEAITGGSLRVSELIYRAQVACGISAKVILVMLQKEQGLVTDPAPTDWELAHAMGQGCPDTAPCSSAFAGLANQIVSGTAQLKTYRASRFARQPGMAYIGYHPSTACGGRTINLRNFATAALYNYTPYQPNAAALANLYGTGNSCSAYGNRNFWRLYTDWFGSTQRIDPLGEIAGLYEALGGASGVLGASGAAPECSSASSACVRLFGNGAIVWTRSAGATAVYGALYTTYASTGGFTGPLGRPFAPQASVTDPNGNGVVQQFAGGWIHSSAKGTFSSSSTIMTAYSAAGWLRGSLGWPTGAESCANGWCGQSFSGGVIRYQSGQPAHVVPPVSHTQIKNVYDAQGAAGGPLGYAVTPVAVVTDPNGNGYAQRFEGGWIHSSAKGTFSSSSTIMTAYSAAGWLRGSLGWPTGAESCANGWCGQSFSGGVIRYQSGQPAHVVPPVSHTQIKNVYDAQGAAGGPLGYAVTPVAVVTDPNGNGYAQRFEGGWIHSSAKGTFSSSSTIMTAYSAAGWLRGSLGWPTGPETCTESLCTQSFAGGKLTVPTPGSDGTRIDPQLRAAYDAQGGASGPLGIPVALAQRLTAPSGNGLAQEFTGGWIHSSTLGAFPSSTEIATGYKSAGWVQGVLGWPRALEAAVTDPHGNGRAQAFAGGWVHASASGSFATSTTLMTAYSAAGWLRGPLGWPIGAETAVTDPNGNGLAQQFAGGWIHSSAQGTYSSSTTVMTAYSTAGWLRGKLGWPTGVETCAGGVCTQNFQGGVIRYRTGQSAYVVPTVNDPQIRTVYDEKGGASGSLGYAIAPATAVTDPNGNGIFQQFEGGYIHSGTKGAFATSSPLMTAYSGAGWLRGPLGWPIGPETAVTDPNGNGVVQQFAGGWIHSSAKGTFSTRTPLMTAYSAAGWLRGPLGWPIGPETAVTDPNGNGYAQRFEGGWIHSSAKGTFSSSSTIMTAYSAAGWLRGSLGWPTGAESCANGWCGQSFSGGVIRYQSGQPAHVVPPVSHTQIKNVYDAQGAAGGPLGYAVTPVAVVTDPNGNGYAQRFEGGWIHSSAKGTFSSSSTIMTAYSAAGWLRGSLGWPTGPETCTESLCTQSFAGGTLSAPRAGG